MKNAWFRLYAEFATDPKVQMMSEAYQRRLLMLFCLRCGNGDVTLHDDEVAFQLRISPDEWSETKAVFVSKGFIDEDGNILNWDKRQYTVSYNQQERHREKRESLGLPRRRWVNPNVRKQALARDGHACVYCSSEENLTLDHIIPEIKGGGNDLDNLVTACRACNAKKREFSIEQAGMSYRKGYIPPLASPSKAQASTDTDTDTDISSLRSDIPAAANRTAAKPKSNLSRLPFDDLPPEWGDWAHAAMGWDGSITADVWIAFRDYWQAKTGKSATKSDWSATWRNWCRNERPKGGVHAKTGQFGRNDGFKGAGNPRGKHERARNILLGDPGITVVEG